MKSELNDLLCCETCDGSGKVRANYTNQAGDYVFSKKDCPDCEEEYRVNRFVRVNNKTYARIAAIDGGSLTLERLGGCYTLEPCLTGKFFTVPTSSAQIICKPPSMAI